ncbi:MAG: EamA family transporter [Saprospiraceae bacterium]|nr:EamA family transporter [Saprospiraceae bacterium]
MIKAHIALFLVSLIYASNYTIAKEVMPNYLNPEAIVFARILTGFIVFGLLTIPKPERIEKSDYKRLILCGITGAGINMLTFFKGLNLTTPINASLIMLLVPIIVLIASAIYLKETITNIKIIGIFMGIIGAGFLVTYGRSFSLNSQGLLGDLFIVINATSYSIYLVLIKNLMRKYNTMTVLKWVFTFGLIFIFPFTITDFVNAEWTEIPANIWFAIAFILIGVTILTYFFNAYALQFVNASVVSIYIYLQPLLASIIALSFGKDHLDFTKIVAIYFDIFGRVNGESIKRMVVIEIKLLRFLFPTSLKS